MKVKCIVIFDTNIEFLHEEDRNINEVKEFMLGMLEEYCSIQTQDTLIVEEVKE